MIWLLRFSWAGRDWYVATRACTPEGTNSAGATVAYPHAGALDEPEFVEEVDWISGSSGTCEASVQFQLGDLDVPGLVAQGHHLWMATGEISLWAPGTSYDDREVLFTGPFFPSYIPFRGEALKGRLYEQAWEKGQEWPPADAVVDAVTWPLAVESARTAAYPWVFGKPGPYVADDGTTTSTTATPAYVVYTAGTAPDKVLVAGHPVVATTVTIYNVTQDLSGSFSVASELDGRGRMVAIADLTASLWVATDELRVTDWGAGGVKSNRATTAMETLPEVAEHLLRQRIGVDGARQRLDAASWRAAAELLPVKIAGHFNESNPPWTIYNSCLRLLAPNLYVLGGPRGLRAVVFRDVPAAQCRKVTVGVEVWREPGMRPGYDSGEGLTGFTLRFAAAAGGDCEALATRDHTTDGRAAAARARLGREITDSIESKFVFDRPSAELVCAEHLRGRWATAVFDEFWTHRQLGASFRIGDKLLLTDEDAGYTDRPFWVRGRHVADGVIRIKLVGLW